MSVNRGLPIREIVFFFTLATFATGCTSPTKPGVTQPNASSPTHLLHVATSSTACQTGPPHYEPQFVLETDYPMHVVAHPVPAQKTVSNNSRIDKNNVIVISTRMCASP
jgi:hypothetical protein